jgi:hypothetical protein
MCTAWPKNGGRPHRGGEVEEERMIDVVELTLSGRNRIAFKRTLTGVLYCELLRPGELRNGHGWLVCDSIFVEPAQAEKLCDLLRPHEAHAPAHDLEEEECLF